MKQCAVCMSAWRVATHLVDSKRVALCQGCRAAYERHRQAGSTDELERFSAALEPRGAGASPCGHRS
jgi:hypothetical protein